MTTTFTIIALLLLLVVLEIGLLPGEEFVCTLTPALAITPESFGFIDSS